MTGGGWARSIGGTVAVLVLVGSPPGGAAWASDGAATVESAGFDDVIEAVPGGRIDWSRLVLTVEVTSDMQVGAWKDRRIQEQDAFDRLGPIIESLAERVRITPDTLAADLLDGTGGLSRRLDQTRRDWQVVETRYHDSGAVTLVGELDLRVWLRPALASLASSAAPPPGPGDATGLVVDARALPFEPCLAPRLRTPGGEVLFGAQRLTAAAIELEAPVVYVRDPADPRVIERAGRHPILVQATSVRRGGELWVDPTAARVLEAHPDLPTIAARGRVV
ncbi:MAG: hypothetical protein D6798_16340, partial [Deltaproteobacteria bacterium]